ncbi:hypothetical protein Tco_0603842 [Tanacetum coccineum]
MSKASGPDRFSSLFFKKAWGIVGQDVRLAVKEFFRFGKLLGEVNATLIALIPKDATPRNIGSLEVIKKSMEEFSQVSGLAPNLGKKFHEHLFFQCKYALKLMEGSRTALGFAIGCYCHQRLFRNKCGAEDVLCKIIFDQELVRAKRKFPAMGFGISKWVFISKYKCGFLYTFCGWYLVECQPGDVILRSFMSFLICDDEDAIKIDMMGAYSENVAKVGCILKPLLSLE